MTIPLPNLDDRTYADLIEEARALIPREYPVWTDHNPSDSGIVLLELFAWLTELVLYRVNQIPDKNIETFLKLLKGPEWTQKQDVDLQVAIRQTVLALRHRYRAVACEDFEQLALEDWPETEAAKTLGNAGIIRRAKCLPQLNLAATALTDRTLALGHVSLVVVPMGATTADKVLNPTLQTGLWTFLDQRRLLTTQHHVVGPEYVPVQIKATLHLEDGASAQRVRTAASEAIHQFFDPLEGGVDHQGWPFGRSVYMSEVYELLDRLPGVDYAENVILQNDSNCQQVELQDYQLVAIDFDDRNLGLVEAWESSSEEANRS
jgi:Baseplate J-like protein